VFKETRRIHPVVVLLVAVRLIFRKKKRRENTKMRKECPFPEPEKNKKIAGKGNN